MSFAQLRTRRVTAQQELREFSSLFCPHSPVKAMAGTVKAPSKAKLTTSISIPSSRCFLELSRSFRDLDRKNFTTIRTYVTIIRHLANSQPMRGDKQCPYILKERKIAPESPGSPPAPRASPQGA